MLFALVWVLGILSTIWVSLRIEEFQPADHEDYLLMFGLSMMCWPAFLFFMIMDIAQGEFTFNKPKMPKVTLNPFRGLW